MNERRSVEGSAYRRGELVCERVVLTRVNDARISLAPGERRYATVRFARGVAPGLHRELARVLHARGARARRVAEGIEPIELELDGERRLHAIGPPLYRGPALDQVEFHCTSADAPAPCPRI